jgi:hypothetical protein
MSFWTRYRIQVGVVPERLSEIVILEGVPLMVSLVYPELVEGNHRDG